MDLKKIIGTNIIRIRRIENLNQTALAKKIDISRKQLCKIERGETYPTADTIQRIADGLAVQTRIQPWIWISTPIAKELWKSFFPYSAKCWRKAS